MRPGISLPATPALTLSARADSASPRTPRLRNLKLLESLPPDVGDYLDGREPSDLAAVLRWAIDNGEEDVLGHGGEKEFQGAVRVVDLGQMDVLKLAVKLGLEIELPLVCRIDAQNVGLLIPFLEESNAKVRTLCLNLSPELNHEPLSRLRYALDALYGRSQLTRLDVSIAGQAESSSLFPRHFLRTLGESTACVNLSAFVRHTILVDSGLPAKVEDLENKIVPALLQEVADLRKRASECPSDVEALRNLAQQSQETSAQEDYEKAALITHFCGQSDLATAELRERDIALIRLAPEALAAFLSMDRMPDKMLDALVHVAFTFKIDILLRAVGKVAPHYVIEFHEVPDWDVIQMKMRVGIPCSLRLFGMPAKGLTDVCSAWRSQLVSLDLTLINDLRGHGFEALAKDLARLSAVQNLSITIAPGISIFPDQFNGDVQFQCNLDSLILQGGGASDSFSHKVLEWMIDRTGPRRLTLGAMTAGAAADLIREMDTEGLEELFVSCEASPEAEKQALVDAVKGLLRKPHVLADITVRSEEPLPVNVKVLNGLIHENPPARTVRIEHFSSSEHDWEGYVHMNLLPRRVTETFFADHLGLPMDLGAVTANMLRPRDLPALMAVSMSTYRAGEQLRFRQTAILLAFRLRTSLDEHAETVLDALEEAPDPTLMAKEVRQQLSFHLDSRRAIAWLDGVTRNKEALSDQSRRERSLSAPARLTRTRDDSTALQRDAARQ